MFKNTMEIAIFFSLFGDLSSLFGELAYSVALNKLKSEVVGMYMGPKVKA